MRDGTSCTVIVCGSRTWSDESAIRQALAALPRRTRIVAGGARGADAIAARIARELGFEVVEVHAEWGRYGRAAGPIRNQRMLDEYKPSLVLAFRVFGHSPGTDDMVRRARAAGVPVIVIRPGAPARNEQG